MTRKTKTLSCSIVAIFSFLSVMSLLATPPPSFAIFLGLKRGDTISKAKEILGEPTSSEKDEDRHLTILKYFDCLFVVSDAAGKIVIISLEPGPDVGRREGLDLSYATDPDKKDEMKDADGKYLIAGDKLSEAEVTKRVETVAGELKDNILRIKAYLQKRGINDSAVDLLGANIQEVETLLNENEVP